MAEALAHGVPVLTTTATPWQALESEHCGWWIDDTPEAIAKALDIALSLPDAERAAMGARGRAWMRRDFSWNRIARGMAEVYAWRLGWGALDGASSPAIHSLWISLKSAIVHNK